LNPAPPRPSLRRAALSIAVALCALATAAAPARATHNANHVQPAYGAGALRAEWLADFPLGVEDLQRMSAARIGMYRTRFRQDEVAGFTGWSRIDRLARIAAENGVGLQPILINMPGEVYTPPKTAADRVRFAEFATAAVQRYGPTGSFWDTCACPKLPVRVWEVWNEPNVAPFWDVPSPAEYGALLTSTKAALRSADPAARVLFGGLAYPTSLSTTRLAPNAFLRDVIQAAGAGKFDALALHNYRPDPERAVNTLIAGTVQTLKTYGGVTATGTPKQQVWLNEFGRPTQVDDPATPVDEQADSEAAQRAWLDAFLDRLLPNRTAWNVGPVMWYSLRDSHEPSASWLRQGLRRTAPDDTDAGPKPSWDAYTARSAVADLLLLPAKR
jgi:polysaccharide biosynthesis protein PslG